MFLVVGKTLCHHATSYSLDSEILLSEPGLRRANNPNVMDSQTYVLLHVNSLSSFGLSHRTGREQNHIKKDIEKNDLCGWRDEL